VLFLAQLPLLGFHVAHGQVVVAMQTLQRTAARHFNRNLQRHTLASLALVQVRAKRTIT
jgi:hypothetical protein